MDTMNRAARRALAASERREEEFEGVPRRYLNVPDGARYLGISTAYLWKIARDGALPLIRIGGRTLVDTRDLDALVARSKS